MYLDTGKIHLETRTESGVNQPTVRGPWPTGTRRVFWAIEHGKDAHASEPRKADAPGGLMEITLADGIRIRVDSQVDGTALRRVLEALQPQQTRLDASCRADETAQQTKT